MRTERERELEANNLSGVYAASSPGRRAFLYDQVALDWDQKEILLVGFGLQAA